MNMKFDLLNTKINFMYGKFEKTIKNKCKSVNLKLA